MTLFYILLKLSAFLTIIIIPLTGPKKKKAAGHDGPGRLAVNEDGYLEYFAGSARHQHTV